MQKAFFASLAAVASAEIIAGTASSKEIPRHENTWSYVDVQEFAENEPDNESVTLQFLWQNKCDNKNDKWQDGTWVQNYAVWESTTEPGVYRSVSCAAEYFNDNEYSFSPNRQVNTYEGEPLDSKTENPRAASSFTPAESEPIFSEIGDLQAGFRQTWQKKQLAQQNCAVVAEIYSVLDGEVVDQDVSDSYWSMKNSESPVSITTGFRIWGNAASASPSRRSETVVPYTFFDFGLEEIVPIVEEEVGECLENCDVAEDGDTIFGIQTLYVIIAAILLVLILVLIIVCCCCFGKSKVQEKSFKFGRDADAKPVTIGTRASRAQGTGVEMADNSNKA